VLDIRALTPNTPSLSSSINLIQYEAELKTSDLEKQIDPNDRGPFYFETKSGKKNILEGLYSISIKNSSLTCALHCGMGQISIYDLLAYLTGLPQDQAKKFKVTRTMMFIKKEGELCSPMEVN
jgi:hypothetical protein